MLDLAAAPGDDARQEDLMHLDFHTALVVSALVAAIVLAMNPGARLVPAIALVTAAIAAAIDFKLIQLSSTKFRIDVILPAILVVTGGISWSRSSSKSAITCATIVTIAGAILLSSSLRLLR